MSHLSRSPLLSLIGVALCVIGFICLIYAPRITRSLKRRDQARLARKAIQSTKVHFKTSGLETADMRVEKHVTVRHWLIRRNVYVDSVRLLRLPFSNTWCVATKDGLVIRDLLRGRYFSWMYFCSYY